MNQKMSLSFILIKTFKCKECNKEFTKAKSYYKHKSQVHVGSARCLLCGLNQKSATRKDMKIRHLIRCKSFQRDCLTFGATTPFLINKLAKEMSSILFEFIPKK
jgi:uncharacterized Zn-finger protein